MRHKHTWPTLYMVKCLASWHKYHNRESNPYSAETLMVLKYYCPRSLVHLLHAVTLLLQIVENHHDLTNILLTLPYTSLKISILTTAVIFPPCSQTWRQHLLRRDLEDRSHHEGALHGPWVRGHSQGNPRHSPVRWLHRWRHAPPWRHRQDQCWRDRGARGKS